MRAPTARGTAHLTDVEPDDHALAPCVRAAGGAQQKPAPIDAD
jgi:hypothetical protein